ncbi:Aldehyde dehydrogenase family 3 member F1 [Acorus calamus]|uniref:Aldehyde dehydrogenase n=1 Tax=Acorus calamus TaxID=4465 RepID=A0AAV9D5T6_ACOCL|nr:Aldehyde dehydrogenase family 3 member F1 [Acorus calamus]
MEGLEKGLEELRQTFGSGKTRDVAWRKSQLRGLLRLLNEEEEDIFRVLHEDLGKHRVEAYRDEVLLSLCGRSEEVGELCSGEFGWLDGYKEGENSNSIGMVKLPWLVWPSKGEVVAEPLGLVLVFSSWNFPIGLTLECLIGAISAGNVVVLKPSEQSPASSLFLANCIPMYIDSKAVKIYEGGSSVAEKLLEYKWDKIFFTGSARVGRIVMTAAAKHLTPVTLELGGKCLGIVDSRLSLHDKKVDLLIRMIKKFFAKNHLSRIVNKQQYHRLSDLFNDPSVAASIVHGGSRNIKDLVIEPTIMLNPPLDAEIMTEEIFGPLLPIITLNKIEDSIEFLRSRPKPLAIYAFTNDEKFQRRIVAETSSGSITFNDAVVQYVLDALPFGGVGGSGFGKYHGKYSFDTFSNDKAVLRRGFFAEISFRYPPWDDLKLQFIRACYDFDYIRLLRLILGLQSRRSI